jgi:tetratricopeptide (TPR) repeat protein
MASPEGTLQRNYRFKELPIFPSHTDIESYEPSSCARIAARYRPFLEIRPPGIDAPILCHAPLMLYRYLESEHVEYFGSVTLQRAMVLGFREELRSSMHGRHLGEGAAEGLVEWGNSPNDRCRHVFDMWSGLAGLPAATRAKVIKLITALGFFTEAREAVEGLLYEDQPSSPDEFYLHVLRHYVVNLTDEPGSYRSSLGEELSATVHAANSDPRILRMLLNLSVYGMVQSARRKDVQGVEQWRDSGRMYLAGYTSRDEVSDFESHLMTSRYWRAATFLPYLTGDHDSLVREFQLVLDHAHAAEPGSDQEVVLQRENLIPAYESASRTYQAIGRDDEAIEYMERASAVDPLDSKVLLQVGDLYQRRSDFETASSYFDRAAAIAVPHGALSWFRAGRARHLAGDHAGATDRYLRSVELQPAGVSNYRNIMSIAREQSDTYLHSWAASALAGQK